LGGGGLAIMGILAKDLFGSLAPYVGDSGVCPDQEAAILAELNEVMPMLIKRMDAKGTVFQWCVPAEQGCFGLPHDCLEVRTILLDGFPLVQRDQWYEGKLSVGMRDQQCLGANCDQNVIVRGCGAQNIIDLGDGFPTPYPWPETWNGKLGLKAENEADKNLVVQVNILNEYLDEIPNQMTLLGDQGIVLSESFVRDIRFIRKPVTKGNVIGYYVCNSGRKTKLFTLAPRVTTPQWRRKRLPAKFPCGRHGTILIRGKARFIPLTSGDDVVLIDDVTALQFALRAKAALKRDDPQAYNTFLTFAVNELDKQLSDSESRATVGQAQLKSPFGRAQRTKCWT
jgi:hypothetical protein